MSSQITESETAYSPSEPQSLLTFEFVGLCMVIFFSFCNITVFYNLFNYLQSLGIPGELAGLVIGAYSFTAMILYLVASPYIRPGNAFRIMLLGMTVTIVSGFCYFFIHSFWGLLGLRMISGFGQFFMGAGAMAIFVSVIPPQKSGQAFGLYSVAILVPYGGVPAFMDAISFLIPTPPHGYALATITLIPAALVVYRIYRKIGKRLKDSGEKKSLPAWSDIRHNVKQIPIFLLLLLNMAYFTGWGSLFFLFKGFASEQNLANVGVFFSILTGLMIVIRLLAGRLFDEMDKVWLIMASFLIIAVGHVALDHLPGPWAVPFVAVLFGLGMGAGYPAINGMMFEISPTRFRPLNANLMLFAVQGGFFFGPFIGGVLVAHYGYHGYFVFSIGLMLLAAALTLPLVLPRFRKVK